MELRIWARMGSAVVRLTQRVQAVLYPPPKGSTPVCVYGDAKGSGFVMGRVALPKGDGPQEGSLNPLMRAFFASYPQSCPTPLSRLIAIKRSVSTLIEQGEGVIWSSVNQCMKTDEEGRPVDIVDSIKADGSGVFVYHGMPEPGELVVLHRRDLMALEVGTPLLAADFDHNRVCVCTLDFLNGGPVLVGLSPSMRVHQVGLSPDLVVEAMNAKNVTSPFRRQIL